MSPPRKKTKIDFVRRRRVMERSQRLGHCICDARRICPCDLLRERNVCPCAGERPELPDLAAVRLTEFAHNTGCASKIPPAELDAILGRLPPVADPAVVSGLAAADDAAIYRLSDTLALVQTVDVFTPCVDDPRRFGKICAANCLSDIYAMGGTPRTALSVLCFPSEKLPGEVVFQMLSGAMETFQEAGVSLVGGHSVQDPEIKLGFAITGVIETAVAAALEKPAAGDVLVLTKPLGTGVLTFARQIGRDFAEGLAAAETSMLTLNRPAAEAMRQSGASACTDITGFGLFAHLRRMLRPTTLGAEVFAEVLPGFPGALEALRQGIIPGAIERNHEYIKSDLFCEPGVDEALVSLGLDAQTSGGLLIAIPPARLELLRRSLLARGADAFVIGRLIDNAAGQVLVKWGLPDLSKMPLKTPPEESPSMSPSSKNPGPGHDGCCAEVFNALPAEKKPGPAAEAFAAFLQAVQAGGALSEKTKELIQFSLVVYSRCQPCFETHLRKARALGLTPAELDEAAWCAVAMGGAPVKMFYAENTERIAAKKAEDRG